MNTIRSITYMGIRGFRKARGLKPDTSNVPYKIKVPKQIDLERAHLDLDELDPDDPAQFESDFSKAHEYYDQHIGETKQTRGKLLHNIIKRKYFKQVNPSFLTLAERNEIRELHENDPEEWSIERISESFPILPEDVTKILQIRWKPKTVKRAVMYDKKVAENWKQLIAGKIVISPALREHLKKFGNREIDMKDRDILVERFVAKKIEFPEPKTKVFSTILNYIEHSRDTTPQLQITSEEDKVPAIEAGGGEVAIRTEPHELQVLAKMNKDKRRANKKLTFTEFVENKYDEINKNSQQEGKVLLDMYKKHMESTSEKGTELTTESNTAIEERSNKESRLTAEVLEDKPAILAIEDKNNYALSTYVAKWEKLHDIEPTYYYPIQIPKGAYQKGKIYRIGDCFYDGDGEFLYRVPGIRS